MQCSCLALQACIISILPPEMEPIFRQQHGGVVGSPDSQLYQGKSFALLAADASLVFRRNCRH